MFHICRNSTLFTNVFCALDKLSKHKLTVGNNDITLHSFMACLLNAIMAKMVPSYDYVRLEHALVSDLLLS